jgi:hypothetical protein
VRPELREPARALGELEHGRHRPLLQADLLQAEASQRVHEPPAVGGDLGPQVGQHVLRSRAGVRLATLYDPDGNTLMLYQDLEQKQD